MKRLGAWILGIALLPSAGVAHAQHSATLTEVQVSGSLGGGSESEGGDSLGSDTSRTRVDGGDLQRRGENTLSQVANRVPGLFTFGSTGRLTGLSIRGLGNNQANDGLDSSVGLYVDGVYLARQGYIGFGLFDLEDIEVRRGPQGASYGVGSTAGEVLLRTAQPSHTASRGAELSVGSEAYHAVSAYVTGSVVPGELAARFSVYNQRREGLIFNRYDGSQLNDQDRLGVRGQLLWTPQNDLLVRVVGEHSAMDQRCCAIALLAPVSARIQASDAYMGYNRPGTNPYDRVTDNDVTPLSRLSRDAVSMVVEYGPIGRHRLVSVTGLNRLGYNPAENDDGTSLRLLKGSTTTQSTQFSQEFRWETRYKRLSSSVGALFLHQDLRGREVGVLGDQIARWAIGGALRQRVPTLNQDNSGFLVDAVLPPQALNGLTLQTPYRQRINTWTAFASGDLKLSEVQTLGAGLRYTILRRHANVSRSRSGGDPNASPLVLTNNLQLLGNLLGQDLSMATYDGLLDALAGKSFDRSDARTDSGVSGQLTWRYALNPGLMSYSVLTRGYKSGGLNLAGLSSFVQPQFLPEVINNLEVGLRSMPSRAGESFRLAAYRGVVKNFQALSYAPGDGLLPDPRQNNVLNIPRVTLTGVEGELSRALGRTAGVSAGLAYNRAISTDFRNAPNEDSRQNDKDLSGQQLYNAPRWSGFVGAEKRFPWRDGLEWYAAGERTYRSETFGAVDQSRSTRMPAYQLTNVQFGLRNKAAGWNVQAWVNNVFDVNYLAAVSNLYSLGEYGGYAGDPRTFGVTLGLRM